MQLEGQKAASLPPRQRCVEHLLSRGDWVRMPLRSGIVERIDHPASTSVLIRCTSVNPIVSRGRTCAS